MRDVPFLYEVTNTQDGYIFKVPAYYNKTSEMKYFKSVFHKAAVCVGCGVCESNCRYGVISFNDGLYIENCHHCMQCHNIENGCYLYDSIRLPKNGDTKMEGTNTFSNNAYKTEWLKYFFDTPEKFLANDGNLGSVQHETFIRTIDQLEKILSRGSNSYKKDYGLTDHLVRVNPA